MRVWPLLCKFGKFGESGKFGECGLDRFIHIVVLNELAGLTNHHFLKKLNDQNNQSKST
jgi:hypothetical protein